MSAESAEVVFDSDREGKRELYVIDLNGANLRKLPVGESWAPAWSSDGDQITFISRIEGTSELYVSSSDGSDIRRLTNNDWAEDSPSWSPDGQSIAFVAVRQSQTDLYLLEIDTKTVRQMTDDEAVESDPTWLPDGSQVEFSSNIAGERDLYLVDADTSMPVDPRLVIAGDGMDQSPTWADGVVRLSHRAKHQPLHLKRRALLGLASRRTKVCLSISRLSSARYSPCAGHRTMI
jgi:TolB protein